MLLCIRILLPETGAEAQLVSRTVSIENAVLSRYLNDSDYDVKDYTYTHVDRYTPDVYAQCDKPAPVVFSWEKDFLWRERQLEVYDQSTHGEFVRYIIPGDTLSCSVYNLVPGHTYAYVLLGKVGNLLFPIEDGSFFVEGRRRMLKADFVTNIRDFGGLRTEDGRTLRYGRLYRGAALDHVRRGERTALIRPEGLAVFRDIMRIGADIDLRGDKELLLTDADTTNDMTNSLLGADVEYYNYQIRDFGAITSEHLYGPAIAAVVNCLERGKNVYIHCAMGADRTGVLSFLLEAMAGVCENDLARDYELTSLTLGGTPKHTRNSLGAHNYAPSVEYIKKNFSGKTFAEKVQNYLILKHDVTREQIRVLQRILVE